MDEGRHRIIAIAMVVIGLGALLGYQYFDEWSRPDIDVMEIPIQSRDHVADPNIPPQVYSTQPPTSGPHVTGLADAGVYNSALPLGLLVHNLEHSHVVAYYSVERVSQQTMEDLQALADTHQGSFNTFIAVPLEAYGFDIDGEYEVILTAWGAMMQMEEYEPSHAREFLRRYHNLGHH